MFYERNHALPSPPPLFYPHSLRFSTLLCLVRHTSSKRRPSVHLFVHQDTNSNNRGNRGTDRTFFSRSVDGTTRLGCRSKKKQAGKSWKTRESELCEKKFALNYSVHSRAATSNFCIFFLFSSLLPPFYWHSVSLFLS